MPKEVSHRKFSAAEHMADRQYRALRALIDEGFQAFNAARLSEACRIYADKMLDPANDTTIGLTVAGALTPAMAQQGVPYRWAGASPSAGFDCSGLLQYVYKQMGIDLPRVSFQQANYGERVPLSKMKVGDLVAWDNSSRNNGADHIAMYIGNGQILEAARPGTNVRIRKLGKDEGAWGVKINK